MKAFKNLGTSALLTVGKFPAEMVETLELIEKYFQIKGRRKEIGCFVFELLHFRWEGIMEMDKDAEKLKALEGELFKIHQGLNEIFSGRTNSTKITINYKNRTKTEIENPEILFEVVHFLSQLPGGKAEPKSPGRIQNKFLSEFKQIAIENGSQFIKNIIPEINETDKLFFTGLILSMIGIFEDPKTINDNLQVEESQIPLIKAVFVDRLRYYKSTQK
jgi:hypothetical protein